MPDISYLKIRPQVEGVQSNHSRVCSSHPFAELQVTSNFSFLRGASHPEELITRAAELGYRAIAITDHNSLAGIVRAHRAAKLVGIKLIIGCRLELTYEGELSEGEYSHVSALVYPKNRAGYGALCRLLTTGKRRATSGTCLLTVEDLLMHCSNLAVILLPPTLRELMSAEANLKELNFYALLKKLREQGLTPALAITRNYGIGNNAQVQSLIYHARHLTLPLIATNDVYYHTPERRILQDTLCCIRNGCTIENAGYRLFPNAERYLKPPAEMHRLFRDLPEAIRQTIELTDSIDFSLNELRYEYPDEICPASTTPLQYLRELCVTGAKERYPNGTPGKVLKLIEEELTLIAELKYEKYFLTCYDIVKFARSQEILCQGRGAAANSAVCFMLGITSVDPDKIDTLFARFISKERNEPPDIDIDFEHERREEVIQYIYRKYGRERAGLTAEVITYRHRSAVRDIGKALGLSLDLVTRLAKSIHHWCGHKIETQQLKALGISPEDPTIQRTIELTQQILGFPRHLSQHVGGFIISEQPLCETVPILNAAMAERTTIEWDKDDIEELGLLKIDILALGMLSCVKKALGYVNARRAASGEAALQMHSIPAEDPKVYDMISAADTIGVFQIESRAQMSMLPRLKPRCFYDLVIEVAIVRPGPIRGNMVHPYLKRRSGVEPCEFPDERVRSILGKTLGVPIFQEQAMRLAIVLAKFSPGEAEQLRRAMAAWKHNEGVIAKFKERIISGMLESGYSLQFAEACMNQIRGFSEYGFPESHAASFALIVYASAWLKCHYPAEFAAALINSQPMGFYQPAQIVSDAKAHGIRFEPIDVNESCWNLTLPSSEGSVSIRLGMRLIKGLQKSQSEIVIAERNTSGRFSSLEDLWERCAPKGLRRVTLSTLARADAFTSLSLDRRQAAWKIRALPIRLLPFDYSGWSREQLAVELPKISPQLSMFEDYASIGLSLTSHPLFFLRKWLEERMVSPTITLRQRFNKPINASVSVAGLVIIRQRPGTAKGFTFITIEDETGITNLVLNPDIFETHRTIAMFGRVLLAHGKLERVGDVTYVNVRKLEELSTMNAENHPLAS